MGLMKLNQLHLTPLKPIIYITLILLVVVGTTNFWLYSLSIRHLDSSLLQKAGSKLDTLESLSRYYILHFEDELITEMAKDVMRQTDITYLSIVNELEKPFFVQGSPETESIEVFQRKITYDNSYLGMIRIGFDTKKTTKEKQIAVFTLFASIAISVFALGILIYLFYRSQIINKLEKAEREKQYAQEEATFVNSIIDTSSSLMLVLTYDGVITHFNKTSAKYLSDNGEILIGTSIGEHFDVRNNVLKLLDCIKSDEAKLPMSQSCFHSDWQSKIKDNSGNTIFIEWSASNLNDLSGKHKYIILTGQDVTEQREYRKKLKGQLAFFQTLIDTIPSPIFYKDRQGLYIGCNKEFESYIGLTNTKLSGKSVYDIAPKELADIYKKADDELYESGGIQIYETQVKYADGTIHDVIFNKAVFLDSDGDIGGMVGVILDITELKKANQEKIEMEAQLYKAQKLEAIGTLAGGIAHDFNNILSAIMGATHLAQRNKTNKKKLDQNLEQIFNASKRAAELVKQILTFCRNEKYEKHPLKAYLVINEALKLLESTLPATIELRREVTSRSIINANHTQIHQVVMNLCVNAFQAISNSEGSIHVKLYDVDFSFRTNVSKMNILPGLYLCLEIQDTGCGIAPDILDKIFDPYFTTKEISDGTGLGLSTVHGIVKEHGGFIEVESKSEKGTNFKAFFPVEKEPTEKVEKTEKKSISTLPEGRNIMLVDDESSIVFSTKEYLEEYGLKVFTYSNGEDALIAFQKDPNLFDLIITDLTMPRLSGDNLCKEIKQINPEIPLILCSGNLNIAEHHNTKVDKIFKKPVDFELLIEAIGVLLK